MFLTGNCIIPKLPSDYVKTSFNSDILSLKECKMLLIYWMFWTQPLFYLRSCLYSFGYQSYVSLFEKCQWKRIVNAVFSFRFDLWPFWDLCQILIMANVTQYLIKARLPDAANETLYHSKITEWYLHLLYVYSNQVKCHTHKGLLKVKYHILT